MATGHDLPPGGVTQNLVPTGLYGPGTKSFNAQALSDAVMRIMLAADMTNRVVGVHAVDAFIEIQIPGEVDASNQPLWRNYTASIAAGDANIGPLQIRVGLSNPLPMVAGRQIRGGATINGAALTTKVDVTTWVS